MATGVRVSIGYPPDTDTEGYQRENETKPRSCVAANSVLGSDLFPSERVARALWRGIARGAFHLPSPDPGQALLLDSMAGLSPGVLWAPLGALLAPVVRLVLAVLRVNMDRAVAKVRRTQEPLLTERVRRDCRECGGARTADGTLWFGSGWRTAPFVGAPCCVASRDLAYDAPDRVEN